MDITRVELRHLRALQAIAEEGSFGAAADVLGYSQAAVSQQIAALEHAIGQPMFDRPGGPRPAVLTAAGRILLSHAQDISARLDTAASDLADLASGTAGRLRIGTYQSVSVQLLPDLVQQLRLQAPALSINLVEHAENDQLVNDLLAGDLDISFLVGPMQDARLEMTTLGEDPFVAVLQSDGSLAREHRGPTVPTHCLDLVPMVGQDGCSAQRMIDDGLRMSGVRPRYAYRSSDNGAMQGMVRAGMGPAVMPLLAVDARDPGIVVKHLDPPVAPRTIIIALARGGSPTPAARRFLRIARSGCRKRLSRTAR